jgi:hypothetical protein
MITMQLRPAKPEAAGRAPVASAATISTTLLLPGDRLPREPLGAWAERLGAQMDRSMGDVRQTRRLAGLVAGISNNAALIAAHEGRREVARVLCQGQITWQYRLARRSRDIAIAAHGIQPWVNLGRLEALAGDVEAALERFAPLASYRGSGWITFGRVRVHGTLWSALSASQEGLLQALDTMYVVDSLRALLMNRRFEETLAFVAGLEADLNEGLRLGAAEAVVVAACSLGDTDRARDAAARAARETRGWSQAVFRLRLAETLACAGSVNRARDHLRPVLAAMRQVSAEKKREPNKLLVLLRLAGACAEVGLGDDAGQLAREAYDGARAARDEVFEIESLRLLSTWTPPSRGAQWRDALARLEESTRYTRYHRGGQLPADPAVDALYARLCELFAA